MRATCLAPHMHRDYRGQLVGLVFEHCRDHSTGLLRQRVTCRSAALESVRLVSQCNIRQDALAVVGEV